MKALCKNVILIGTGGNLYYLIELLWRGCSHISMVAVGGLCFWLIGLINEKIPWEMPLYQQMGIGAVIVTAVELISGIILNIILKLGIWDYSDMPFNLLGQICLPFSIAWFFLSLAAILLDDYMRYWMFGEEKPHYTWRW